MTLLALLADMDSCLQARTTHCTSISTEATFLCSELYFSSSHLYIVHCVHSAIWRALEHCSEVYLECNLESSSAPLHCAWSAQWSPCPAGTVHSALPSWLEEATVHYKYSAQYSAQLVGRGNQPRRAGRNCTSCLIIVAAILIFFLFAFVIFSVD